MPKPPSLFLADVPPEDGTEFDFDRVRETLQAFISSARDKDTLNICLSGDWGTGKTTLLKELEKAFAASSRRRSKKGKTPATRYVTVWFDPWKLGSEKEIRNALARAVLETIERDSSFSTKVEMGIERKNVLRVLSDRLMRVNPDEVNAFYKAEKRTRETFAEVEDIFRRLAEVYLRDRKQPRRMVIFVDDLDRCPPSRVIDVLEAVKLFFDLPGLIFVFGLDTKRIEHAIKERYSLETEEAKTYLEKIFQLRVPLPPKGTAELMRYVQTNLTRIGVELENDGLLMAVVERFDQNPRRLKLFINDFSYQRQFIRDIRELEDEELFYWLYLQSTVGGSLEALREGPVGYMLALDFIAHGGFLDDEATRDLYLRELDTAEMNYVALIAYAVASKHDDVELPPTVLSADNNAMVEAMQADEAILPTLRVLREGSKLLIESDLQQITDRARSEDNISRADGSASAKPEEKDSGSLRWGNPLRAQEWNMVGDRLLEKAHVGEAYLSYLLATMMEPEVAMYIADLAKPFRQARQYEAARELLARAFDMDPTSSYVLGEVAFFYDVTLVEEDIGSILYRKAILYGNANSSVRFNLALNLHKQKRLKEAFLSCLDAWARDPENDLKRDRTTRFAQDAGYSEEQVKEAIDSPGSVLTVAHEAGEYPFPVTEEEERQIQEHVLARPDPDTAASQLERPPL